MTTDWGADGVQAGGGGSRFDKLIKVCHCPPLVTSPDLVSKQLII